MTFIERKPTTANRCELRIEKMLEDGGKELVCGAGGFTLKVPSENGSWMAEACAICPIPDELSGDGWACLYLRPIRVRESGAIKSYFSCRWFYSLNPTRQPESIKTFCHGCTYWFPRPQVQKITGYWAETEAIREVILHPSSLSNRFADWRTPPSSAWRRRRSWWRRVLTRAFK